jgi:hypothetical protein
VVRDVLKLCAPRGACTVSRGGSRSNVASLPDLQEARKNFLSKKSNLS